MKRSLLKVILLAVLLILGVILVLQRQLFKQKAGGCFFCPTGSPTATLGQNYSVSLDISGPLQTPNAAGIIGIRAVLSYPTDALNFTDISALLPSPWSYTNPTVTSALGTSYLTIDAVFNQAGTTGYIVAGNIHFASVDFIALAPGNHTLYLDSTQSQILAKNANEDLLQNTQAPFIPLNFAINSSADFSVQVNPGSIDTSIYSQPTPLSAEAVDQNGSLITSGVTFQWSMSSTNSIGNLIPNPTNPRLATFIPQNPGTGNLCVTAHQDSTGKTATKCITMTVTSTLSPTPTITPTLNPHLTPTPTVSTQCIDTDGGINPSVPGTASYGPDNNWIDRCIITEPTGDGYRVYETSSCTGANCSLSEAYCQTPNYGTSETIPCPRGCSTGACQLTTFPPTISESTVVINNYNFLPKDIVIYTGDSITWVNNDQVSHTVTNDTNNPWDSGFIAPGGKFTRLFPVAGTFSYHCSLHPTMTGTITVLPISSTIPTNNTVNWSNGTAYLKADNFYLKIGRNIYLGKPDPGTTMNIEPVDSNVPNTSIYRNLELSWTENTTPLRLNINFTRDDNNWWVYGMRIYNPSSGIMIEYLPGFSAPSNQEFTSPINSNQSILPTNQAYGTYSSIHWRNLKTKAFINYYPTPTPAQSITVRFFLQSVGKNPSFQLPTATLLVKQSGQTISTLQDTARYTGSMGEMAVFEGQFIPTTPITPGTYSFFLKSPSHLQKHFGQHSLVLGENIIPLDWSIKPIILIPGDFDNNNKITFLDISQLLNTWISPQMPVIPANQKYDLNFDGTINILDVSLLLNNWTAPEILGDN